MHSASGLAVVRSQFAALGRRALRMDVTPNTIAAASEAELAELRSEIAELTFDTLDCVDGLHQDLADRLQATAPLAGTLRSARRSLTRAEERLRNGPSDARQITETRSTVLHVVLDLERGIANAIGRPSFMSSVNEDRQTSPQRRAARERILQGLRDALACSRINGTRARHVALTLAAAMQETRSGGLSLERRTQLRRLVEASLRASIVADPVGRRAALGKIMDDIACLASTVEARLHDDALALAA